MDLTIIIVNWNTRDLLRNCLRSIAARQAELAIQTIVVDNASKDASIDMVRAEFSAVEVVESGGNVGFARGNNAALGLVRAPLVLFLNPDTEILGDALQRMVAFMDDHPKVGALGCKIRNASGQVAELGLQWTPTPFTEALRFLAVSRATYRRLPRMFPYHDPEISGPVTKLFGACLVVRRSVLDGVGSFDERFFMYCEDVDLCHRIGQAGWQLYYFAEAEILHLGGQATAAAPSTFKALMSCESFAQLMRKQSGLPGAAAYRVVTFLGAQLRLAAIAAVWLTHVLRRSPKAATLAASAQRYLAMIRWTVGPEKPVIRR